MHAHRPAGTHKRVHTWITAKSGGSKSACSAACKPGTRPFALDITRLAFHLAGGTVSQESVCAGGAINICDPDSQHGDVDSGCAR